VKKAVAKLKPLPSIDSDAPEPIAVRMPADARSVALTILAVVAVILFLQHAQALIIPFVLGALISYAVDPLVTLMVRLKIPRALAAALVLVTLFGTGGVLLYQLRSEAEQIVRQVPEAARRLRQLVEDGEPGTASTIKEVQKAASELEKVADAAASKPPAPSGVTRVQIDEPTLRISQYLMWGSLGLIAGSIQLLMILFLAFFLLASGDLYRRKLVKLVGPSLAKKRVTVQVLEEIEVQIERFLLVQVATSTVVGVATWVAFRTIGLEQAGVWGLLAGVFNSIPYFGPVVVTGGAAVVGFLQFGNLGMAAWAAFLAFAITTLEGFLLTPWLTSRAARMNAVAVFVGLLFWGWVWDVWGLLLAVPMLMVIKSICDHVEDFKGVGELLGD
jgi:predicted PurR-regulated permease PerM